jgi:CubicO group peptidase (beta-lactamase class C family)
VKVAKSIRRRLLLPAVSLALSNIALGQSGSAENQSMKPADGWGLSQKAYDKGKIGELKQQIVQKLYKDITSVVVIDEGKVLIEEYFNGATRATLHDTRSVGKTFASALAGLAMRDGYLKSETQTLREFYDLRKFANYSPKKESVTLKSLLTMTSGFLGDDSQAESPGNEEKMYPTSDWVKFALDLPMDPNKEMEKDWSYFTAGVVMLGDILHRAVPDGLEKYADRELFEPLGIKDYQWQYTPQKVANTAGGLRLRSLDLAKFGLLYKNGGAWNGKQILPRRWVESSLSKQVELLERENEYYGYLFWNKVYTVDGKQHEVFTRAETAATKSLCLKIARWWWLSRPPLTTRVTHMPRSIG